MKKPVVLEKPCAKCGEPVAWTRLLNKTWDTATPYCSTACRRLVNRAKRQAGLPIGEAPAPKLNEFGHRIWTPKGPKKKR